MAYTQAVYTFIESSMFRRILPVYLDDDEYGELQQHLMLNREAGEVVRGSGGVRKLRWARPGMGTRGGLRVIYYVSLKPNEFWMLTLYSKSTQDSVPVHVLTALLETFRDE